MHGVYAGGLHRSDIDNDALMTPTSNPGASDIELRLYKRNRLDLPQVPFLAPTFAMFLDGLSCQNGLSDVPKGLTHNVIGSFFNSPLNLFLYKLKFK